MSREGGGHNKIFKKREERLNEQHLNVLIKWQKKRKAADLIRDMKEMEKQRIMMASARQC